MSLYCTICRYPVPESFNSCTNCRNGFIPQLACASCNQVLPRGSASCFRCRPGRPKDGTVDLMSRSEVSVSDYAKAYKSDMYQPYQEIQSNLDSQLKYALSKPISTPPLDAYKY